MRALRPAGPVRGAYLTADLHDPDGSGVDQRGGDPRRDVRRSQVAGVAAVREDQRGRAGCGKGGVEDGFVASASEGNRPGSGDAVECAGRRPVCCGDGVLARSEEEDRSRALDMGEADQRDDDLGISGRVAQSAEEFASPAIVSVWRCATSLPNGPAPGTIGKAR
jgi:hypothetical protein